MLKGVDELSPDSQARLLASLPSVDADERPDWRIISSACSDLTEASRLNRFRLDLLHRLKVVAVKAPPLRERSEDIASLARLILLRARRRGLPEKALDPKALSRLEAYRFPGNVRELENILYAAAALGLGATISGDDIARVMDTGGGVTPSCTNVIEAHINAIFDAASPGLPRQGLHERLIGEFERPLIRRALAATHGNQIRAAALLGINRNTLRKKIQSLDLRTGQDD